MCHCGQAGDPVDAASRKLLEVNKRMTANLKTSPLRFY